MSYENIYRINTNTTLSSPPPPPPPPPPKNKNKRSKQKDHYKQTNIKKRYVLKEAKRNELVSFCKMGIPLTDLNSPHFGACPYPRLGFLKSYVVVFFVFSEFS